MTEVRGRQVEFPDGRIVFFGHSEGGHPAFMFKSKEGVKTGFTLTPEAFDALIGLLIRDALEKRFSRRDGR